MDHEFYIGHCTMPTGEHHELELKDPVIWTHKHRARIHFQKSKLNSRRFVLHPNPIPTFEEAQAIFLVWAVGTAFTMKTGIDYGKIYKGDKAHFLGVMEARHKIAITGISVGQEV